MQERSSGARVWRHSEPAAAIMVVGGVVESLCGTQAVAKYAKTSHGETQEKCCASSAEGVKRPGHTMSAERVQHFGGAGSNTMSQGSWLFTLLDQDDNCGL